MNQMYKNNAMFYVLSIILITQSAHSMVIRRTVSQLRSFHTTSRVALCHDKNVKKPLKDITSDFYTFPWNKSVKTNLDPHKVMDHLNATITGNEELKQYIRKVASDELNYPDHIRLVGTDKNKLMHIATAIACALERPIYHIDLSNLNRFPSDKEFAQIYTEEWVKGIRMTQANNPALIITIPSSQLWDQRLVFKTQDIFPETYFSNGEIKILRPIVKTWATDMGIRSCSLLLCALRIEISSYTSKCERGMFQFHIQ